MATFSDALLEMAKKYPPNPNDPVPLYNRLSTIYGVTISFHVLSWIAVLLRLYYRFAVVHEPGWDDYIIILAALFNTTTMVSFQVGANYGLGRHLLLLSQESITITMKCLYVTGAAYITTTALVKLSLLCQYLRLFKSGLIRYICIALLVLVTLWGLAFSFLGWIPCLPVDAFWKRKDKSKCYALGFRDMDTTKAAFVSFAALNMSFDTLIFLIPMVRYFEPNLKRKQIFALTGLFLLGSVVVLMAVLRLWTAVKHSTTNLQSLDFTWWYPLTLIYSCLECDFAIMCASMPIFWPVIITSFNQIFVTREVRITQHERLHGEAYELELGRSDSLKSQGSEERLTMEREELKQHYQDPYTMEHVKGGAMNNDVEVKTGNGRRKKSKGI